MNATAHQHATEAASAKGRARAKLLAALDIQRRTSVRTEANAALADVASSLALRSQRLRSLDEQLDLVLSRV